MFSYYKFMFPEKKVFNLRIWFFIHRPFMHQDHHLRFVFNHLHQVNGGIILLFSSKHVFLAIYLRKNLEKQANLCFKLSQCTLVLA